MSRSTLFIFFVCSSCFFLGQSIQIGFYNVENLFDTINEPGKMDGEFTPDGAKQYNSEMYKLKLHRIARVITGMNDWKGPDVLGLAEIENEQVLKDLLETTILHDFDYHYIHYESPDERGIDVALLYKTSIFDLDTSVKVPVEMFEQRPTRDILHVRLLRDTAVYDVFVNHWPSRYGGVIETEGKRKRAALELENYLLANDISAPLIMGDFNDPISGAAVKWLEKVSKTTPVALRSGRQVGTLKYRSHWYQYDHFLVGDQYTKYLLEAKIYCPDWLLEEDTRYNGIAPKRFFRGDQFNDGYSDHLPIYIILSTQSRTF